MHSERSDPLPRGWSKHVKTGLMHAISLAAMAQCPKTRTRCGGTSRRTCSYRKAISLIIAANVSGGLATFSANTKAPISPIQGLSEKREHSEKGYSRGAFCTRFKTLTLGFSLAIHDTPQIARVTI